MEGFYVRGGERLQGKTIVPTTKNAVLPILAATILPDAEMMFHGARVCARDLRGGAALALAALCAEGETVIERIDLIDRGYPHLEDTLAALGGRIKRIALQEVPYEPAIAPGL